MTPTNRKWRVHRFVLAMHSYILLERCTDLLVAREYKLELGGYSDPIIEMMISFMYTLDYESNLASDHVVMYNVAEELNMFLLMTRCQQKFASALPSLDFGNVANDSCVRDLVDNLYHFGAGPLCDIFVKHTIDAGVFGGEEGKRTRKGMLQLAADIPAYGADLIKEFGRRESERKNSGS